MRRKLDLSKHHQFDVWKFKLDNQLTPDAYEWEYIATCVTEKFATQLCLSLKNDINKDYEDMQWDIDSYQTVFGYTIKGHNPLNQLLIPSSLYHYSDDSIVDRILLYCFVYRDSNGVERYHWNKHEYDSEWELQNEVVAQIIHHQYPVDVRLFISDIFIGKHDYVEMKPIQINHPNISVVKPSELYDLYTNKELRGLEVEYDIPK